MKPNIIVFHVDSWDGRKLSCLGDPEVKTPHADRLAARSAHFVNAYCGSPLCCPSRAILWSGQHAHATEAWNNHRGLPIDDSRFRQSKEELVDTVPAYPTLMSQLHRAGYRTNLAGVLDFTRGGHSLGARLSAWLRSSGLDLPVLSGPRTDINAQGARANEPDWQVVDAATEWLSRIRDERDRPFFLSLGVRCPHPYRTTSEHWLSRIDPGAVQLPPLESDPHPIVRIVRRARECDRAFSEDERRFLRRRYAAMIAEADAMLGRTMQAMDELGLWENTYFVFVSDHGEMDLEHNLVFKSMHHEPSSRVAMMVAGPGVNAPQRVERCASLVDVCPSLLALAEVSPEGPLDGRSLMPALIGDEASLADEAFSEYHANGLPTGSFMLRRGPWKYHAYIGYPGELFHLPSDPGELTNLIDAQPQQAAEMDRALRRIVDPEAIDAKAKRHDRESFARWRHGLDEAAYQQAMTELYGTWDDQRQAQIDAWLNEDA